MITIELTEEEAKIVIKFLRTTSVQGTLETLTPLLSKITEIIKKISDQLAGE